MLKHGIIKNRAALQQIKIFKGLRWGTITPTDIDGFFDFKNKIFIFVEIKFKNTSLKRGQGIALQRLTDACQRGGIQSYLLICNHKCDIKNDIDCANTKVIFCRNNYEWFNLENKNLNLKDAIDKIIKGKIS